MRCPFCQHPDDKVVDSREAGDGDVIRRRRECLACKRRFTTYERIDVVMPMVVKKDGRREPWDRAKLEAGFHKACEKRPVPATARPYLARLKAAFAEERVPAELVWVAEVESSFNPTARSPVGAEGMFQLTKPTAQAYGLSTFLPDERKDPVKSARVAARHLRHLHERFGDWSLALAAYNAGERRVEGLLKGARTKEYSAIAHRLPAETQMYVPKCEAAVRRREGMSLDNLRLPRG